MRKRLFLFILPVIVFLLVFIGCKTSQNTGDGEELSPPGKFEQLLNYMRNRFQADGVPGGVVAVITNGTLSYSSGVGVKRYGTGDAMSVETLFFPGSVMELFQHGIQFGRFGVRGSIRYPLCRCHAAKDIQPPGDDWRHL